jgi:hypothetical protein
VGEDHRQAPQGGGVSADPAGGAAAAPTGNGLTSLGGWLSSSAHRLELSRSLRLDSCSVTSLDPVGCRRTTGRPRCSKSRSNWLPPCPMSSLSPQGGVASG